MAWNILYAAVEIVSYDIDRICLIWEEMKNDTLFKQCGIIILWHFILQDYTYLFFTNSRQKVGSKIFLLFN